MSVECRLDPLAPSAETRLWPHPEPTGSARLRHRPFSRQSAPGKRPSLRWTRVRGDIHRVRSDRADGVRKFPEKVFIGELNHFSFFDSDWIFETKFVEKIKAVLVAERSACACISNLDAIASGVSADEASFIIDQSTTDADYALALKGSQSKPGWNCGVDRFACSSETGTWCIYCERRNEIAVVATKASLAPDVRERLVDSVKALPIRQAIEQSHIYGLSAKALSPEWRTALIANYEK